MDHFTRIDAHWLVSNADRAKAQVKYEIKWLENRLKYIVINGCDLAGIDMPVSMCQLIGQCYGEYLKIMVAVEQPILTTCDLFLRCNTWRACYEHIQSLKQQLSKVDTAEDEALYIDSLRRQYQLLASIFAQNFDVVAPVTAEIDLPVTIKSLVQVNSPADWLRAVVAFANQSDTIITAQLPQIEQLNNQQLLHLAQAFNQDNFIQIMSAIFFYKLYPEKLYQGVLHPEKLVSVKSRLTVLHDFVETLHLTIMQTLGQRGLNIVQDYLFHSEELPQGIEIDIGDGLRELIQSVVKLWRANVMIIHESDISMGDVYDLFRAYKYWFNPNRLIDVVMILQQRLSKSDDTFAIDSDFYRQMAIRYRQLTTTECLDLYGYFSNKDTCYLMRTLLTIKLGTVLSWMPVLMESEQLVIVRIYDALECVMNALRDELATRHITTTPYERSITAATISPGHRNRNAVIRLISLYGKDEVEKNTRIEQLFNAIEAYE